MSAAGSAPVAGVGGHGSRRTVRRLVRGGLLAMPVTVSLTVLLAAVRPAAAAPVCDDTAVSWGVVPAAGARAEFGSLREACSRNAVALAPRATAAIDPADYYGQITVANGISARLRLDDRWALFAAADLPVLRYTVNAVLASTAVDLGPVALGAARSWRRSEREIVTVFLRLLLPVDSARRSGAQLGGELGLSAQRRLSARMALQGGVTVPTTLTLVAGTEHLRSVPAGLVEVVLAPRPFLAFAIGLTARVELVGDPAWLALAPRAGALLRSNGGWLFGVSVEAPLIGVERTTAAGTLILSRAFR